MNKKPPVDTEKLSKMLTEERARFIQCEMFMRQISPMKMPIAPPESAIEMHLQSCKDYYLCYGTIEGRDSPWIPAYSNSQIKNGS